MPHGAPSDLFAPTTLWRDDGKRMTFPGTSPVASVLIPAFNAADTVEPCLESVLAEDLDLEVLVVDDGSVDSTARIVESIARRDRRVTLVRHERNLGLVAALTTGLGVATGELVARLDADDLNISGRLAAQLKPFRTDPGLVLCWTAYEKRSPSGVVTATVTPPLTHGQMSLALVRGNRIVHSTVMFRASAVQKVGGYDAKRYPAEDYDLWCRLLSIGRGTGLPIVGASYLVNPSGISLGALSAQEAAAREISSRERAHLGLSGTPPEGWLRSIVDLWRTSRRVRRVVRRLGSETSSMGKELSSAAIRVASREPRWKRWFGAFVLSPRWCVKSAVMACRGGSGADEH